MLNKQWLAWLLCDVISVSKWRSHLTLTSYIFGTKKDFLILF